MWGYVGHEPTVAPPVSCCATSAPWPPTGYTNNSTNDLYRMAQLND